MPTMSYGKKSRESGLQPKARLENPPDRDQAARQKGARHGDTHAEMDVRKLIKARAKTTFCGRGGTRPSKTRAFR